MIITISRIRSIPEDADPEEYFLNSGQFDMPKADIFYVEAKQEFLILGAGLFLQPR
jgi:hypothetical protein